MLVIRLQRTGRSGHANYRVVVQDSRWSAKSGKVVAFLGSYDPHTKAISIDKEKAATFLINGAQPSPRVTLILKNQGVKLPSWVVDPTKKTGAVRNPQKRRSSMPEQIAEPKAEADEAISETTIEEKVTDSATSEETAEASKEVSDSVEATVEQQIPAEETK